MMRAGLLDVDGVLLASEPVYYAAVRASFEPYGIRIGREEYVEKWITGKAGSRGVIEHHGLAARTGKPADEILKDVRQRRDEIHERLAREHMQLMPGAIELLDRLKAYPLGFVTSSWRREVERGLGKFGLLSRFAVQVTGEEYENDKPHPEPFQMGLRKLRHSVPGLGNLEPGQVLAVEDNPSGVASGKAAGCMVIAYPNGFTDGMEFPGADAFVSNLYGISEGLLEMIFR